jgi:hypothetical protein
MLTHFAENLDGPARYSTRRCEMRRSIFFTLLAGLIVVLSLFALPGARVSAAREVVVTITEREFNQFLSKVRKDPHIAKLQADIIDGGIIMTVTLKTATMPVYQEHYGVLIRDAKVVTEAGKFFIPGYGGLGYEDVRALIPEYIPVLDHNAKTLGKYVLDRIRAKAGTRYTPVSVTTGEDKVVIVVNK